MTATTGVESEGTATVSFPAKLRLVLEEAEAMGLQNIVSWEMNGTAFRVHKSDDFVEVIMGRWFNQTKYKSFQRVSTCTGTAGQNTSYWKYQG